MRIALYVVAGLLAWLAALGWCALLVVESHPTKARYLAPDPLTRLVRFWRSRWQRSVLWFLAWPHLVDRVVGSHRVPVGRTPSRPVRVLPGMVLSEYLPPEGVRRRRPVLLVHAFVTQPWILDLLPGRSLVEALRNAGHPVFLLDWAATARRNQHGLADRVRFVAAAENDVLAATGADAVHLVGYCTGGTAALAAAARYPEVRRASVTTIAPIVDAAVPSGLQLGMAHQWLAPPWLLDENTHVPGAVVREAFHVLRPELLRARIERIRRRRDPAYVETYAALVRWAWEQRPVPGRVFFDLVDLYRHNTLYEGRLVVQGRRVDLAAIRAPVLVACTDRDHIVPIASSLALTRVPGLRTEVVRCPAGHVSMLMGTHGRAALFPAVVDWLRRHEEPLDDQLAHRRQRR